MRLLRDTVRASRAENIRLVHVDTPCGRLVLRAEAARTHALGSQLRLRLDAAQISLFDAATEARL